MRIDGIFGLKLGISQYLFLHVFPTLRVYISCHLENIFRPNDSQVKSCINIQLINLKPETSSVYVI